MPKAPSKKPSPPKGQHIFADDELHQLALRWKELNAQARHDEAMLVLEQIIKGSTQMFERFAQHEKYHNTVDLDTLVSAAQEKVVKWLLRWDPRRGKLFTWFSKCAKHAFLSELVKVNNYRRRFHATSDNLETFVGVEDHEVDRHDMSQMVREKLSQLTCRWGNPQEIGAIRYFIDCIVEDTDKRDRNAMIRAVVYAWGVSWDQAKYFHRWALAELRSAFFDCIRFPITEEELFMLRHAYSDAVDLVPIIGWERWKQACVRHGGSRIKFPPIAAIIRAKQDYKMSLEIARSDNDPDSIARIAARHKRTAKSASDTYEEMTESLKREHAGRHHIYGEHEHA